MAETSVGRRLRGRCPICGNPIVVRVGIIEKHATNRRATFTPEHGRPLRVEWCEASEKRWYEVAKKP